MSLRHAYLLTALFFCLVSLAQEKKGGQDSVKRKSRSGITSSEFDLKNYKSDPNDRMIIEVNHTGWTGLPAGIQQSNAKCIGVNFSVMFDKPLGKSAFSFGYGIGIFSHNFHSNADFIYHLDSAGHFLRTSLEPFSRPVKLNRYAQKVIEIPLELRFRTKTDRQFKAHIGGRIGYVVNDFRSLRDSDGKVRIYEIRNINQLRYGVNLRIGFEQIAFCASYYFSEVFRKDRGPAGVYPYAFGIAIIPY